MARSPLSASIRRAIMLARSSNRTGMDVAELMERRRNAMTRRQFLGATLAAGAALGVSACATTIDLDKERAKNGPRVVVVGAGLGGLTCAYELAKAGIKAAVYEASPRVGGRAFTKHDILKNGAFVDLGGEFLDVPHVESIALCKELGVRLIDMRQDGNLVEQAYFSDGKIHSEAELIAALKPMIEIIDKDMSLIPKEPKQPLAMEFQVRRTKVRKQMDERTLADYFELRYIKGWLRKLMESAYVTEFGMESNEQSAMNMLSCFYIDADAGRLEPFGHEAETIKMEGGAQAIATALAEKLDGSVELEHRLTALRYTGGEYLLTFARGEGSLEVSADFVVLALPFTMLREVDVRLELPREKKQAIAELGYGNSAKLLMGMASAPWRAAGFAGGTITDLAFQLSWDNARMQGKSAGLTFFLGGKAALELGKGTPREQVDRLLPELDKVFPGSKDAFNGHFQRMHWPSHPFLKAGYAAYKPGQYTTIRGNEQPPVGNLFFAGEHVSEFGQGYLNGGVETGMTAAKGVLEIAKTRGK
ncbi:MAG: FAD-dependent oxidoreductase [Planctomycetes bacterium]|nr:FAD-dependent oxidoreductase [Planctomycetota bacterium]